MYYMLLEGKELERSETGMVGKAEEGEKIEREREREGRGA